MSGLLAVHRYELHIGGCGARLILIEDVRPIPPGGSRSSADATFLLTLHEPMVGEDDLEPQRSVMVEMSREDVRRLSNLVDTATTIHDCLAERIR